jgi:hypothetical protein
MHCARSTAATYAHTHTRIPAHTHTHTHTNTHTRVRTQDKGSMSSATRAADDEAVKKANMEILGLRDALDAAQKVPVQSSAPFSICYLHSLPDTPLLFLLFRAVSCLRRLIDPALYSSWPDSPPVVPSFRSLCPVSVGSSTLLFAGAEQTGSGAPETQSRAGKHEDFDAQQGGPAAGEFPLISTCRRGTPPPNPIRTSNHPVRHPNATQQLDSRLNEQR